MLRKIIKLTLTTSAIVTSLVYATLNFRSYYLRHDIDEKQKFSTAQGYLIEVGFAKSKHVKAIEIKLKPEFEFFYNNKGTNKKGEKKAAKISPENFAENGTKKLVENQNKEENIKLLQIMGDGLDFNSLKNKLDAMNIDKDFITVKYDEGSFVWSLEKNFEQLIDYSIVKKYHHSRNVYSLWGGITFLAICLTFLYFFLGKKWGKERPNR